jgi:hypothetical protein
MIEGCHHVNATGMGVAVPVAPPWLREWRATQRVVDLGFTSGHAAPPHRTASLIVAARVAMTRPLRGLGLSRCGACGGRLPLRLDDHACPLDEALPQERPTF